MKTTNRAFKWPINGPPAGLKGRNNDSHIYILYQFSLFKNLN